jgi:hypothetical protein
MTKQFRRVNYLYHDWHIEGRIDREIDKSSFIRMLLSASYVAEVPSASVCIPRT